VLESVNPIEILLMEKLEDIEPALDVIGSDCTVLQVASQDFINYLKFHWNLIGREAGQVKLVEQLEKQLYGDSAELEAFLSIWVCKWLKKWRERVKLLIGDQKQELREISKPLNDRGLCWKKFKHKQESIEVVVGTLIRSGEICGAEILAENLLKEELENKDAQRFEDDREYFFDIIHEVLHRARKLSQSRGALIFVTIGKQYYNSSKHANV